MSSIPVSSTQLPPLRLLIIDDHEFYRRSLCRLFVAEGGFMIAGEAADGLAALALVSQHRADVALMDIEMPGMDGLTATRQLRTLPSCPPIILLTTYDSAEERRRAEAAGAQGYLAKDATGSTLFKAIREVARGHSWFQTDL